MYTDEAHGLPLSTVQLLSVFVKYYTADYKKHKVKLV